MFFGEIVAAIQGATGDVSGPKVPDREDVVELADRAVGAAEGLNRTGDRASGHVSDPEWV